MISMICSVIISHVSTSKYLADISFLFLAVVVTPSWFYGVFYYKTSYKKQKVDEAHQQISEDIRRSIVDVDERVDIYRGPSLFDIECPQPFVENSISPSIEVESSNGSGNSNSNGNDSNKGNKPVTV